MSVRAFRPLRAAIGAKAGHGYNAADLRRQLDNLTKNFKSFQNHMEEQAIDVLYDALKPTFDLSQKYVPVDTGRLKDSGYLVVEKTSRGVEAAMGYSYRGNPHYALYVHEIPRKHAHPTRWKFLQAAIQEDGDRIPGRITQGFKKAGGVNG